MDEEVDFCFSENFVTEPPEEDNDDDRCFMPDVPDVNDEGGGGRNRDHEVSKTNI